jgi:ribosomal protein S18 acetylase RimI-like enzyme
VSAFAHVEPTLRLLGRSGYTPVRWWNTMRLDLADPPAQAARELPGGLRVVPFDPRYDDAVRRAHNEAFAGHWGSSERDAGEWAQWFTGQRAFSAATSHLALDGDEVAGYLLAYHWAAEEAATGVREAYIGQLGTRSTWRGRGVATALLGRALAASREAGFQRASLDVDTANATGALGLYERFGFAVDVRRISHVKPLPAAEPAPRSARAEAAAG